jgi:hypothetical protein
MTTPRLVIKDIDVLSVILSRPEDLKPNEIIEFDMSWQRSELLNKDLKKLLGLIAKFPDNFCVNLQNLRVNFGRGKLLNHHKIRQIATLLRNCPKNFELNLTNTGLAEHKSDLTHFKNMLMLKKSREGLTLNFSKNNLSNSIDTIADFFYFAPDRFTCNLSNCGLNDKEFIKLVTVLTNGKCNPTNCKLILRTNHISNDGLRAAIVLLKSAKSALSFTLDLTFNLNLDPVLVTEINQIAHIKKEIDALVAFEQGASKIYKKYFPDAIVQRVYSFVLPKEYKPQFFHACVKRHMHQGVVVERKEAVAEETPSMCPIS